MSQLMDLDEALSTPGIDALAVLIDHIEAGTDPKEILAALRREQKRQNDFQRGIQKGGRTRDAV